MITPIEISPSSGASLVKTLRFPVSARKQVVVLLTDALGNPVDLNSEVLTSPAASPVFGAEPPATTANTIVRLRAVGDDGAGIVFDIPGKKLTQTGYVEFDIDGSTITMPGIYKAEIGRFAGIYLTDTWPVLICAEPTVFQTLSGTGPLSLAEVRLSLLDVNSGDNGAPFNNLLDGVEFTDQEVAYAIRRVVDMWNETPPPVSRFTVASFPYRYYWTVGVSGLLLQMGASRYRRNRLQYSAGGVTVDDQSKDKDYDAIGQAKTQEFKEWMLKEKVRINMGLCWSSGL